MVLRELVGEEVAIVTLGIKKDWNCAGNLVLVLLLQGLAKHQLFAQELKS